MMASSMVKLISKNSLNVDCKYSPLLAVSFSQRDFIERLTFLHLFYFSKKIIKPKSGNETLGLKIKWKVCFHNAQDLSSIQKVVRHSSVKKKSKPKLGTIKHRNLIQSSCESLAARGFLRSYKPYTPGGNVQEKVLELSSRVLGTFDQDSPLSNENKFNLLKTCFEELNYSIPNSQLHKIVNVRDVIEFYETPVSTTCPYDELKNKQLPPNLQVQFDYARFHPDTDTLYDGISAFPRSSTIVTGLRYKGKYKGHKAPSPYRDTEVYTEEEYEK